MIEDKIHNSSRLYHIRRGDAHVFGEDSDVRKQLEEPVALTRWTDIWRTVLEPEIRKAPIITSEEAKELLDGKQREYAIDIYQFRQFSIKAALFIARLSKEATDVGLCDQLWSVGAHRDNTRLCMYFIAVKDKDRFEKIARELGWQPQDLALQLVTDFVDKFPAK